MGSNPFLINEPEFPRNLDTEQLYSSWFLVADKDQDGKLLGADAVKFFERSGLPRDTLAKVWALSDNARRGYLDQKSFGKAMNLISIAQQSGDVSTDLYMKYANQGPLEAPAMSGVDQLVAKLKQETANPFVDVGGYNNSVGVQPPPVLGIPAGPSPRSSQASPASNMGTPMSSKSSKWSRSKTVKKIMTMKECTSVVDGLKIIYFTKIRPLEEAYKFGDFFSSYLNESDFHAKPSVLLLGQYSTGKTTFVKHLLKREYPGINIGPEPTTDRFVVVMSGMEERRTPGNTLIVQPDKPFQGLAQYGNGFLAKFELAQCPSPLLDEITLVDTPGVLSGEKQRIERTYNFLEVCGWFAARCDLILLLFDPHKLDISDEMKQVIGTLKGHDDKVRVVLNKADQVDMQQLMRVYGALMWSLGKVFRSPEVCKVYLGSFNDKPIRSDLNPKGLELFEKEQEKLLQDLYEIPQRSCDRKVNEFVKRIRAAKIHIMIMGHLRKQMPAMMGKQKAQEKMMRNLADHFSLVQREHHLPLEIFMSCLNQLELLTAMPAAILLSSGCKHTISSCDVLATMLGDFPDVTRYRDILSAYDLSNFPKLREKDVKALDDVLSVDIPALVRQFDNPYN